MHENIREDGLNNKVLPFSRWIQFGLYGAFGL